MELVKKQIVDWLTSKLAAANCNGFVVGVSGGVDSGVVSTLCAETGKLTYVVSLPIYTNDVHLAKANLQCNWLSDRYSNIVFDEIDLSKSFYRFEEGIYPHLKGGHYDLAMANTKSRFRMAALYAIANARGLLVAGTGNKVEDYGIGFFSKGGDGMVDLSPIGDLYKSEVRKLAEYLGIPKEVAEAVPTDGLWDDDRSDEDQIGATYDELEEIMKWLEDSSLKKLSERQSDVLLIYLKRHNANRHKMEMPPICRINWGLS